MYATTYREISRAIAGLPVDDSLSLVQPAQPADKATLIQRIVMYYRGLAPFLMYISGLAIFPAKWRLALTAFVQALDLLASITPPEAAPASVTESATSDTTTDPTSTDPSFKAGKDL